MIPCHVFMRLLHPLHQQEVRLETLAIGFEFGLYRMI